MKKSGSRLTTLALCLLAALFTACKSTTNNSTSTSNSAFGSANKSLSPTTAGPSATPTLASTSSSELHSPSDGTPERKAILDAVAAELKRKDDFDNAVFDVESLKVHNGWAYLVSDVDDREGTPYGLVEALVQETAGRWKVAEVLELPGGGAREEKDARAKFRAKYADAPDDIFP
jgi:hypothetical protein